MIQKFTYGFGLLILVTFYSCKQNEAETTNQSNSSINNETTSKSDNNSSNYFSFIEEVLIGFTHAAIAQHMVQTPYAFLGVNEGRINYEAIDSNNVNHFISFDTAQNDALEVYVYNIDFKNNNEHLTSDYFNKLRDVLENHFGSEFETGYDDNGIYGINWTLEGVLVDLSMGTNFIQLEIKQH
jgi:hypothetical protein